MARHGAATDLVTHPDLRDPKANALRAEILAEVRGFPDREVFTGVPVDTVWEHATLESDDLDRLRYINWDWWLEVTAGSRRPADALDYYRTHPACLAIATAIEAGTELPAIILVRRPLA